MATMQIPRGVSPAQIGTTKPRRTIVVDGAVRDVATPWRGVVQLTPSLAEQLWAMRGGNPRPFVKRLAFRYADEMRSGGWGLEYPSEIVVTRDGVLGNGQHRVAAVLACGVPINVEVVLGVDPAALAYMDCGRSRSIAVRHCVIDGNVSANNYAASLSSTMVRIATKSAEVSVRDVQAIDSVYGESIRLVANRLGGLGKRRGVARAGANVAIVQYAHHNQPAAVEFMDSFYMADGDIQPARMLRDYFLVNTKKAGSSMLAIDDYERANAAIAATMRGEEIKQLKRKGEHPCGPIHFARPKGEKLDWSFV